MSVTAEEPTRILFIGNSYTAQIKATFVEMVNVSTKPREVELEFIHPGGKNLDFHSKTVATTEQIKGGDWDFVVLQDQSQTPAIFPDLFNSAAAELNELIVKSGAQTVFYQTWGRRDGDNRNAHLFPDYSSMQDALSKSYSVAAQKHQARIAPVGEVWRRIRQLNPELGRSLYKTDGSHPSHKGAVLASAVIYQAIFQNPPVIPNSHGIAKPDIDAILVAAASPMDDKGRVFYPIRRIINGEEVMITGKTKSKLLYMKDGGVVELEIGKLKPELKEEVEKLPIHPSK